MTRRLLRMMVAVVRLWTFLYTTGMPPAIRDRRRREIESDLADARSEHSRSGLLAAEMFSRLLLGLPDDLMWCIEQRRARAARRLAALVIAATVLASLWLLLGTLLVPQTLPSPAGLTGGVHVAHPLPPPPPPPPCPPPSMRTSTVGCTP